MPVCVVYGVHYYIQEGQGNDVAPQHCDGCGLVSTKLTGHTHQPVSGELNRIGRAAGTGTMGFASLRRQGSEEQGTGAPRRTEPYHECSFAFAGCGSTIIALLS